ncbi:MAG: two-component system, OmpR family, sensor kinase, partial [Actinomycetota bacterium]|nr:two-component system, OmpR family, sensor kinase [Actinomycetota bacterium]
VWAVGCVTFMVMLPGEETIPYHLGWAGFALAFGLGTWSRRQLVVALLWYFLATGVVLERSWLLGNISWDETTEIPLMFLLALLMVWNVLRRQGALTETRRLAERDIQASRDRERLTQLTSHELRTPLTIAAGYIELMQVRATELEDQQDLLVVADELDRLSRVSDRLIRMIQLQDDTTSEIVDIDAVLAQSLERWRVVAKRCWLLDARAGRALGSPERLRTCIDTLVENAIRYTAAGDTIRLAGSRHGQNIAVGVFDSGVGLTQEQVTSINGDELPRPGTATGDRLAGTGLGLSIVRAITRAYGGALLASRAPEGGAALTLLLPLRPSDQESGRAITHAAQLPQMT